MSVAFRFQRRPTVSAAGAIVATVALVLGGCSSETPEVTLDERVEQAEAELVADGATAEVAACVVRLARHDLRRGELDDLVADELLLTCERAESILDGGESDDVGSLAFVDGPDTLGDDRVLDDLWRACAEGSGLACDELFEKAPVGSDYERFGVSCGDREEILHCSELDAEDEPAPAP